MRYLLSFLYIIFFVTTGWTQQLQVAQIFSDHMVLQRDIAVPIWGKASPQADVTVHIGDFNIRAKADDEGLWEVQLPSFPAGGPYAMKIASDADTLLLNDILFGDVWLAGGQSNMQWPTSLTTNAEEELKQANYPAMRIFEVPDGMNSQPEEDLESGSWQTVIPETIASFSGVAYYFGREIHLREEVPIGLIGSYWGGTPAESWVSKEKLRTLPDLRDRLQKQELENWAAGIPRNEMLRTKKKKIIEEAREGIEQGVHLLGYDDSKWKKVNVPGLWPEAEVGPMEGFGWYRKTVQLSKKLSEAPLNLSLGRIKQINTVYFNGEEIGRSEDARYHQSYSIPAEFVKPGKNVIAIRILSKWSGGGFLGSGNELWLKQDGEPVTDLVTKWRFSKAIEPVLPDPKNYERKLASLYNGMIAPIIPYALKGVIWYQGESNAYNAYQYHRLFPALIEDWRVRWKQGYLPFLYVQLANIGTPETEPVENEWAELREAQRKTLAWPNTGMAVAIDVGKAESVHPRNKQDVGKRLALWAEKLAYDKNLVHSGPLFDEMSKRGKEIHLSFDHTGSGLTTLDNKPLKGFAVAGSDQKFYWANAKIEGEKVIVSSEQVADPVAVRYGWQSNPQGNLYNKEGLPASPFRTDDWPGLTHPQNE